MRERMLFLSLRHPQAEDREGGMRTENILHILLEKYDIDLLAHCEFKLLAEQHSSGLTVHPISPAASRGAGIGIAYKDFKSRIQSLCHVNSYSCVFWPDKLPGHWVDYIRRLLPQATLIHDACGPENRHPAMKGTRRKTLSKPYHSLNTVLARRNKQKLMNTADLLFSASEWDALALKALSFKDAAKVHIIPQFINSRNKRYVKDELVTRDNLIVLHWDMSTVQGQNAVLNFHETVYPEILAKLPDTRCCIISRKPVPIMEDLLRKDESLVWISHPNQSREYILKAKAVIAPLFEEGMGCLNILDTWALQAPVVTNVLASTRLGAEHNKNVMIALNAEEMVQNVLTLLQDREFSAILAERGHQTLTKHYDTAVIKDRLFSLI